MVREPAADDLQRLHETLLAHLVALGPGAALVSGLAGRQDRLAAGAKFSQRLVEALGAQLVATAVRGATLDAVLPALQRAIDHRRRLPVVKGQRRPLGGHDLLEVVTVGDPHDVPVVRVEELVGLPLDVVAG